MALILIGGFCTPQEAAAETPVGQIPHDATAKKRVYEQYALTHAGDSGRGGQSFADQKTTRCVICHKVNGQGGEAGPDLSHIAGKFDRPHLIESLLEPSRQIVEGFRATTIVMADGRTLLGIVKDQTADGLTLVDANGRRHHLPAADIGERQTSAVSLMPEGLEKSLSPEQFADLIAYLETLRPQGDASFGAGVKGPLQLPDGFKVATLTTGLTGATAMEAARDGRIFVCEQTGALRVVKEGELLPTPFVTLPVDSTWERGLIGVTVDPRFPEEPYVYVCYVARQPYPHHCVSRFTAKGDVAAAGSERILLEGDDQTKLGGNVPAGHQGGALHFGLDGTLYVAIGEQTAETPAQSLATFQGKMLRIGADGSVPSDNPLLAHTSGKYRAIWALGLRNPFTFAVRKPSGELFINDVGGKFEEINVGVAGANYGWPAVEHGATDDARFRGPIYSYPQASIAGGDFAPPDWPDEFRGRYFFADFVHGWIKTLNPEQPDDVRTFASGLRRPVDLRFIADGRLLVLLRNAWVIDDKFQPSTGTLLEISL
ncbi:MAG TPA: PQQ-dependent sugar dehydrogenase [Pirellulales bacterium]|nr:PQQ-dependent sugar dehydrogenase [Pirellulales bacterium]